MAMKLTSNSFKDGDYLGQEHVLSGEYGFGKHSPGGRHRRGVPAQVGVAVGVMQIGVVRLHRGRATQYSTRKLRHRPAPGLEWLVLPGQGV
jgi:hypothetical protein